MPEGKISAYNIGSLGVNVDKSAIHLEDGELPSAQNAIRDRIGQDGALRKRPGLVAFNGSAASGGSISGGIGLPITLTGNIVGGTTLTGGPTRRTYWAKATTGANLSASQGWWTSSDRFTTAAGTVLDGTPANPRSAQISTFGTGTLAGFNGAPNSGVVINNRFYYAANDYTEGTTAPVIRVFDGTIDQEFIRIPIDHSVSTTFQAGGILSMLGVGTTIYLTVMDQTDTSTIVGGRVFQLDPSTGALLQLGSKFVFRTSGADTVPYALEFHANRLWCGVLNRQGPGPPAGAIYFLRPGIDTAWTLDRTMAVGRGCTFLKSFQGQLFAGGDPGSAAVAAEIEVRSSVGAWSISRSVPAGGFHSTFLNAIVFSGNLYTSIHTTVTNDSYVYKFDGTTWTTQLTSLATKAWPMCWAENGTLFFGGGGTESGDAALWSSTDGTTWVERTSNLATTNLTGLNCIGTLVI